MSPPTPTHFDQPALDILDLLSEDPAIWPRAIDEVRRECIDLFRPVRPPRGVIAQFRSSQAIYEYLLEVNRVARDRVRFEIASNLSYSAYRWIWYIRRLPKPIFSGTLKTTYGYDSLLADVISGWAPNIAVQPPVSVQRYVTFPLNRTILAEVLRLCAWAVLLSEIHAAIRWSSKNVEFRFVDGMPIPIANPRPDELAAVNLYDRRMERGPMSFLGGMATRTRRRPGAATPPATNRPRDAVLTAVVPIEYRRLRVPLFGVPTHQRPHVWASYAPVIVDTAEFGALCRTPEFEDVDWPESVPALLQLLAVVGVAFLRNSGWLANTMQRGYFVTRQADLDSQLEQILPIVTKDILRPNFPNMRFAQTFPDLRNVLSSIRGHDFPLSAGPIMRAAGAGTVCVDLWSATARLNRDLHVNEHGGPRANVRSHRFEDSVQAVIDASPWRPSSQTRKLRKVLRRGSRDLTDIDAIGDRDGTVLLVSCKALFYTAAYDAGDYSSIRNAASTVAAAIDVLDDVVANPVGDNYDFSGHRAVHTLVCTPTPVYTPRGKATKQEVKGLRRACSIDELRRWFAGLVDPRPGPSRRQRTHRKSAKRDQPARARP